MVTQKDGVNLLKLQFPQIRKIKQRKLALSLSLLAHEVDDAVKCKALNKVSRVFDYINYLINNGSSSVKRLVHKNFFRELKVIPVHYPQAKNPTEGLYETEIIKNYRVHYRVCRQNGRWFVKSINIDL